MKELDVDVFELEVASVQSTRQAFNGVCAPKIIAINYVLGGYIALDMF